MIKWTSDSEEFWNERQEQWRNRAFTSEEQKTFFMVFCAGFAIFYRKSILKHIQKWNSHQGPKFRIFEKLVHKRPISFISQNNLIKLDQFGFQQNKNTSGAILGFLETFMTLSTITNTS